MVCTIALAASLGAVSANADEWNKKTVITTSQPIQIADTYLEPGTYVMRLMDSDSDRHIVRVMDADETHVIETVLAIPNYRLKPTGKSRFQFWETPPGYAPALRAWFYPGDNFGQEFVHPSQLKQVAMATSTTAPVIEEKPATETIEIAKVEESAVPAPEPAPAAAVEQPRPAPAPPVAEQPAPAAQDNTQDTTSTVASNQLPKTATYAPLFGLSGLVAFGLYSLLRLRRA